MSTTNHSDEQQLLSISQVAKVLGVGISTAKRLAASGDLGPRIQLGERMLRVRRSAVEAFIASRALPPAGDR